MAITISGSGITSANIADGTIVNADVNDVAASKLTGALPAISGASLTGVGLSQSHAEGQYDGTTTGTITISTSFAPQAVMLLLTVGSSEVMSIGYCTKTSATSSGKSAIFWDKNQTASSWAFSDGKGGNLAFGSDQRAYLDVTAWGSTSLTLTKSVYASGNSATVRYMLMIMG